MNVKFILISLIILVSNCVPLAIDSDKQSSKARGNDCVNKKNTHLLLCQTLKLSLSLCYLSFPDCFEEASSGSSSSSE
jgi:hypothetical protein